jgi:hypothetical protein
VGFIVAYYVDGWLRREFIHSLEYSYWGLQRDISHLNPMKTEIARLGRFEGSDANCDYNWACQVRSAGLCKTQAFVEDRLYHYRFDSEDNCSTVREPWSGRMPRLPSYPWLEVL